MKTTPDYTAQGWPYLTADHYVDVIEDYTQELATKLDNADADVAAAINAANDAQAAKDAAEAAVGTVPRIASGSAIVSAPVGTSTVTIDLPAGRFPTQPNVVAVLGGSATRTVLNSISLDRITSRTTDAFVVHLTNTHSGSLGDIGVEWIAVG